MNVFDATEMAYKRGYNQAIKEFAERVKGSSNKVDLICSGALVRREYTITEERLDQIAEEMGVEL